MKLYNAAFLVFLTTLQPSFAIALPSEANLHRRHDSKNDTMLQIIPDVDFNFNVMATLATAPYQGADIGEILVAASQIKTGDFESYYEAYYDLATRVHNQAKAIDSKKHPVSARNAYFRASTYYRSADAFLHGNWSDPRIMSLWKQQADAFDKAMQLLPIPGKRVELQADNFTVPAIFFKTDKPGRRPTVILGTGYDGSMEDLYHTMGEALLQRGMNAIVYEGPGQPMVRRYQDLGFIPEWERVVTPIVDYVLSRNDVDGSKLALMGFSFGGILAPRAAAFEHRLAAVIALDGIFDFGQVMLKQFGQEITELFKAGKKKEIDEEVALVQNNASVPSTLRWGIDQGEWSFKTHSAYTLLEKSQGFTLKGIVDNIKARVFVGDGQNDMFFPGQAKDLTKQLGSRATYHLFETVSGAGLHCQVGGYVLMNQVSLDWLEDVFANQTMQN
ncbi:hydrolase or acyltransferase (alpha beta hydrolase superfamily) [Fusarium subglutinans]|uniref:Hydrolase or acyltransferase (Alpha beta hydrolase superfamily) n=1 Tax=Gibberella subglutinans TaxID=42677 RepID=A0A8H5QD27_GIBSU|nr:hydrolase or acyltransferase (alpha beta hydrolase superfamily) [Fusarium subglutinans]KAF5612403.1 hydrolase or acyltransferase (alpha beta hydrolase superfamily) [Fusarium subglutinans]